MCQFIFVVVEFGCKGEYREPKMITACSKPTKQCIKNYTVQTGGNEIIKPMILCSDGCTKKTHQCVPLMSRLHPTLTVIHCACLSLVLDPPKEFWRLKPNALDRQPEK